MRRNHDPPAVPSAGAKNGRFVFSFQTRTDSVSSVTQA